jgi:hypothetical protein
VSGMKKRSADDMITLMKTIVIIAVEATLLLNVHSLRSCHCHRSLLTRERCAP